MDYQPSKEQDDTIEKNLELAYLLNCEIIIIGDFNVDYLKRASYNKHPLMRAVSSMSFKQLVTMVTRPRSGTCLDHVYTNFPNRVKSIVAHNTGLSDHLPVFGVRLYKTKASDTNKIQITITYRQ